MTAGTRLTPSRTGFSQDNLTLRSTAGEEVSTQAGRVLLFGGDEVYPYLSGNAYELQTTKPYATALSARTVRPDVFAVPGNHDWYDSLVAFSRTFCRPERGFATCRVQQTRSYFALRLPHRWWLLGVDLQLGDDLDEPQVQYFQRVAETLEPDARIILCVPEPQWIYERHGSGPSSPESAATQFLEQSVLKRKISVFVAGDLHCYRRHESPDGVQKIVRAAAARSCVPRMCATGSVLRMARSRVRFTRRPSNRGGSRGAICSSRSSTRRSCGFRAFCTRSRPGSPCRTFARPVLPAEPRLHLQRCGL